MYKCPRCGSIGHRLRVCGVCGVSVHDIPRELTPTTVQRARDHPGLFRAQQSKHYWNMTKIAASTVFLLVAVSSVAAGIYYDPAHTSNQSCTNGAVNFPLCNSCGSSGTYDSTRQSCYCTNGADNPPSCNKYWANNATNPPNCDRCPDNRTVDWGATCPTQAAAQEPYSLLGPMDLIQDFLPFMR